MKMTYEEMIKHYRRIIGARPQDSDRWARAYIVDRYGVSKQTLTHWKDRGVSGDVSEMMLNDLKTLKPMTPAQVRKWMLKIEDKRRAEKRKAARSRK